MTQLAAPPSGRPEGQSASTVSHPTSICHPASDNRKPGQRKGIESLIASVVKHGQLVPGITCPHPELPPPNRLILDGVGRWWACLQLGKAFLAIDLPEPVSDEERRELRIQTNEIREAMSLVELAVEYNYFLEKWRCSQKELARRLNTSEQKVCRALKSDLLDDSVKPLVDDFSIPPSFVPFIANLSSPEHQREAAGKVLNDGFTRDQLELFCQRLQGQKAGRPPGVLKGKIDGRAFSIGLKRGDRMGDVMGALEEALKRAAKYRDAPPESLAFLFA